MICLCLGSGHVFMGFVAAHFSAEQKKILNTGTLFGYKLLILWLVLNLLLRKKKKLN